MNNNNNIYQKKLKKLKDVNMLINNMLMEVEMKMFIENIQITDNKKSINKINKIHGI